MLIGFVNMGNVNGHNNDICLICFEFLNEKKNNNLQTFPQWKDSLKKSCKHVSCFHNECLWKWYLCSTEFTSVHEVFIHNDVIGLKNEKTKYFSCPVCRQICYHL